MGNANTDQERIQMITPELVSPVCHLIDGAPQIIPRSEFELEGLDMLMQRNAGVFLLNGELGRHLELDTHVIHGSNFTLRDDWAVGRGESGQQVYFGELDLGVSNGVHTILPVACKPYTLMERQRAIHEYVAMLHFKDDPNLKSFTPIGFWVDKYGVPTLLSQFEEDVVSLDNVDWNKNGDDPLGMHYDLFDALQKAALTAARLHAKGYVHKDFGINNAAVDRKNKEIRLTDLTTLRLIHSPEDPRPEDWQLQVTIELKRLISSVRKRGYLSSEQPKRVKEMIGLGLLTLHASFIRHPSSGVNLFPNVSEIIDQIDSEILEEIA